MDHNRDPGPGQLTRKKKMEKKKIKRKDRIHIVKGVGRSDQAGQSVRFP